MADKQKNGLTTAEEKKVLAEARSRMHRALEADSADRKRAQAELRFVWNTDNCQWDDDAKKARKTRPCLTENRNPSFIRQATNEVRRSRPAIRVLPVDGQGDPYTAQVYEGLIRNIEANSRADMSYDQATDHAGFCGRGYWKVSTKYQGEGFDQDIVIEPVPDPFSIVDDPDCVYPDKSDRNFCFEVEKVARDEFEVKYGFKPADFKEAEDALGDQAADWQDDKSVTVANYWRVVEEHEQLYQMSDGKVVKDAKTYIAQMTAAAKQMAMMGQMPPEMPTVKNEREYVRRKVEWYCITGMRAISKGAWAGQYIPIVYTTAEQMKIDGSWKTKGMTYDAQDLTKANNYLLSAQVENIALTPKVPYIGPKGAFETDKAKWNTINSDPWTHVEYDVIDDTLTGKPLPPPQRSSGVTGQPEIASVRMGVIDGQRAVVGLMGASLGDSGPEVAFKAIEARQARGDTAIFHVMDNLVRAVRYCGLVVVDLIPKVYDSARIVRIINPDGEPTMQAINQMTPDGKEVNLGKGQYDVTVSAGPAFETQRQQNNALLVDLVAKLPQLAAVAPDLVAKQLLSSGDGEKIAQRLAKTIDPAITGEAPPPEVQKLQKELEMAKGQMGELAKQKDFYESEIAKQKEVLEREKVKSESEAVRLQAGVDKANADAYKAQLELRKKEIEVAQAALPQPIADGLGPVPEMGDGGQVVHRPAPPMPHEVLAPALERMADGQAQMAQAIAALAQATAVTAASARRPKRVTLPDGRTVTSETL